MMVKSNSPVDDGETRNAFRMFDALSDTVLNVSDESSPFSARISSYLRFMLMAV